MEFKKREIVRKPPVSKAPAPAPASSQGGPKPTKVTDVSSVVDSGKSVIESRNTNNTLRKGKTVLQDKRFILVQMNCELFEYPNLIKIDLVLPFNCRDKRYDQESRTAVFAYELDEVEPKELLETWKKELGNIKKEATYTMKTVKVPVFVPEEEEEKIES